MYYLKDTAAGKRPRSLILQTRSTSSNLVFWLLHPVIVVKDRVIQKVLDQGCPPKRTGEWQVSLGCLFEVVGEFRSTEPTLFAFDFPILSGPSNLLAEFFKVSLAKSHCFLRECFYFIQMILKPKANDSEVFDFAMKIDRSREMTKFVYSAGYHVLPTSNDFVLAYLLNGVSELSFGVLVP